MGLLSTPALKLAAVLTLAPLVVAGFFPVGLAWFAQRLPPWARLSIPALACVPYALVAGSEGVAAPGWFLLYAGLPCAIAVLLQQAAERDPGQRGDWRDYLVLAALGLAVDLRWFDRAWPAQLSVFNKMLLLDAGIWAFMAVRRLDGVGFDLRLTVADVAAGLEELLFYMPIALPLGLALGFLHLHADWPGAVPIASTWLFTFVFIAIPEELFFRGWVQNLLERRMGRSWSLLATAALFGLSHFNKRASHFNWRYVLLAALAGLFYGRAWRRNRRVGASAITHASVDAVWSLWLR